MLQDSVNWLAVLIAAAIQMVIGAVYYGLLSRPYMTALLKFKTQAQIEEQKKKRVLAYTGTFVAELVACFVLAHFVIYTGAATLVEGAETGFWLWLGFAATTSLAHALFTGYPLKLCLIDNGHLLLGFVSAGAILAVWS